MQHSFDVNIAKEFGILEAILLNNLEFWIAKNEANGTNYYEGTYWTYNSTKAFNELFPYVSQRQIQNALKKLKEKGIIQTGNYNKSSYDRTLWYAFTQEGKSIMQKCKMDYANLVKDNANMLNGNVENVEPIPNINTNDKTTNINSNIKSNENNVIEPVKEAEKINYEKIVNRLNELSGASYWHDSKNTRSLIKARFNEGFTENDFMIVIEKMCYLWNKEPKKGEKDMRLYLRPSTLFGNKFEQYLNMNVQPKEITTGDLVNQFDFSDFHTDSVSNGKLF